MYYDNDDRIGSISENVGSTFDPSSGATYTENTTALDLPNDTEVTALGELGTDLLVGAMHNLIYPWDRISSSYRLPISLPENFTKKIITVNSFSYIFCGNRGKIYRTNGSIVEFWKKIPDHITAKFSPYFAWLDVESLKDQLYFSFTPTENDGTAITGLGGVWAIDIPTGALRNEHQLSAGSSALASIIVKNPMSADGTTTDYTPAGTGLFAGWDNSGTYGVDEGSSNPYSSGETIIDTDIIPIGTHTTPETPADIEFKLSKPLVSGESIELQQRPNLTASFTTVGTCNTVGAISDSFDIAFENVEWLQIRIILISTATTPSHVPLTETRIKR